MINLFSFIFGFSSAKRKLMTYKQEVSWALSLCRTPPKTCQSLRTLWTSAHPRIRCQSLRTQFRPIGTKACVNRKWSQRHRKRRSVLPTQTDPPEVAEMSGDQSSHTNKSMNSPETPTQKPTSRNDDIDDIFASLGFWESELVLKHWHIKTKMLSGEMNKVV